MDEKRNKENERYKTQHSFKEIEIVTVQQI